MGRVTEYDQSGAGMLRLLDGEALDSMMSVGVSPWHYSKNQDMINLLDSEVKITSADINRVAGLDWKVKQVGLNEILVPGYRALPSDVVNVRTDNNLIVGKVKKRYRVFQNHEAPTFLDNLVDSGEAEYETAGSLHAGSQVYWCMRLPETVTVAGDPREKLETYILFMNSHDGSTAVTVSIVTLRVVCQNTLSWALKNAIRTIKIKHTDSAKEKWAQARKSLEIGYTYQSELAEYAGEMIELSFTDAELDAFLNDLVPTPEPEKNTKKGQVVITNQRGITLAENTKSAVKQIYLHNGTQKHLKGTLWGAVQACSYYTDHEASGRNTDSSADENRFKRLTSGQPTLSSKAFAKALTLV